jgi:hypothetical protein
METNEILKVLKSKRKGTYSSLTKIKDFGNGVVKETEMTIRLGVDYSKLSSNEGRQTGSLPWGKWWIDNKIIEHKGQFYLRCYLDRESDEKPEVRYFVDGKPATDEQLKDIDAFEIKTQDAIGSGRQANEGLSAEKQVIPQNVKFENIVYIIVDDVEYELDD